VNLAKVQPYERSCLSFFNSHSSIENVGVREGQICVRKLAANPSVCALSECAVRPLYKFVTKVLWLASTKNIFIRAS